MTLPLLFGASGQELYGVYHPAVAVGHAGRGVVFCNPLPHEAIATHWAFRLLGDSLARERIHSLRFDYRATGDSTGDSEAMMISGHREDIGCAIDELKLLSGVDSVYLVGIRLGALFALEVAGARPDVVGVVAWEPVLDGSAYYRELMDAATPWRPGYWDVGGLVIAEENFEQLKTFNIRDAMREVRCRIGMITSPHNPEFEQIRVLLDEADLNLRSEVVDDALPWKADSEVGVAPIPAHATRVIKTWLTSAI
jgi:pimeloyl-ACP methyl ester carboxylesterase